MHILEPPWNQSALDQVIGRAVRNRSHAMLPTDQRNVKIFVWTSIKTTAQINLEKQKGVHYLEETADQRISAIISRKMRVNRQFLDIFKCNSLNHWNDPECLSKSIRRNPNLFQLYGQTLAGIRKFHTNSQAETTLLDIEVLNSFGYSSYKTPMGSGLGTFYAWGELWTA